MKTQISRISVHQTAKVFAILSFFMGLVGLIVTLVLGALAKKHGAVSVTDGSQYSADSMGIYILLLPFVYLVLSYLVWLLVGFIYNVIANQFGGIEFDLTDIE